MENYVKIGGKMWEIVMLWQSSFGKNKDEDEYFSLSLLRVILNVLRATAVTVPLDLRKVMQMELIAVGDHIKIYESC